MTCMDDFNTAYDVFEESDSEKSTEQDEAEGCPVILSTEGGVSHSHTTCEVDSQKAASIVSYIKKYMSRPIFLGIVSLYGRARYTSEQYDFLVAMKQDRSDEPPLPCSTTMRKKIFPRMLARLLVKSEVVSFSMKPGYSSYLTKTSKLSHRQSEAVVVLPSSWAKLDIRCIHVLRELACIAECRCHRLFGSADLRVDSTAHVLRRAEFSRNSDTLWVNRDGVPIPSTTGMKIRIHTANGDTVSNLSQSMNLNSSEVSYRGEICTAFNAEIIGTVHIRYNSSSGISLEHGLQANSLDESSSTMYNNCLSFLKNLCRTDHSTDDNDISAINGDTVEQNDDVPQTRRQLLNRNKKLSNRLDDETPYLVPADHLTLLRFDSTGSMGVLVSRFGFND